MNSDKTLKLVECPRDAMQGIHEFIPTSQKIDYINSILRVGFDTIDFGSFVSPKAIPQLKDTVEVLNGLETGAEIIKEGARSVRDGQSVEVINYKEEGNGK